MLLLRPIRHIHRSHGNSSLPGEDAGLLRDVAHPLSTFRTGILQTLADNIPGILCAGTCLDLRNDDLAAAPLGDAVLQVTDHPELQLPEELPVRNR